MTASIASLLLSQLCPDLCTVSHIRSARHNTAATAACLEAGDRNLIEMETTEDWSCHHPGPVAHIPVVIQMFFF